MWGYNPDVGRRRPNAPDPAHTVQMQMQMHAAGVRTGFLGIWTPLHSLTMFQVPYSADIMNRASKVMQLVAQKYLLTHSPLPTCRIKDEERDLKIARKLMMDALADVCDPVRPLQSENEGALLHVVQNEFQSAHGDTTVACRAKTISSSFRTQSTEICPPKSAQEAICIHVICMQGQASMQCGCRLHLLSQRRRCTTGSLRTKAPQPTRLSITHCGE